MYGHPYQGVMPGYEHDHKTDSVSLESSVCTQNCLHPMACNSTCGGNFSPAVAATMSRIQCEGCE